jgi:hypothetical protein
MLNFQKTHYTCGTPHKRPFTGPLSQPNRNGPQKATGEQAASGGRHLVSPEGGATYAAITAATVATQQPSGPLMPKAKGSDPSEHAVSQETAPRRTSSDVSGPMSGVPVGTTTNAHVDSASLPAGERSNKTPIFITGVDGNRAFLAWLQASCPSKLTAQLKAERLAVVPATAEGFRAAVNALRSLDGRSGVNFHTYSLPEDGCVRLLIKNIGRRMPEGVVREEMGSMGIRVQGVIQLRSSRRDQDPAKNLPPTPTSFCLWRENRRCLWCEPSPNSAVSESRWRRTLHLRALCNANAAKASAIRSETAVTLLGESRVGALTSLVIVQPNSAASVLHLRGQPHSELPGMCEMEVSEGSPCKADAWPGPSEGRKEPPSCTET